MITVYTQRLIEMTVFNEGNNVERFCWDGYVVTMQDVIAYIKSGGKGIKEPYGDIWRYQPKKHNKLWHVGRVTYYVQNPSEISGIWVDNYCVDGYLYPAIVIQDGNHRLMAANILKLEKIKIRYGGRCDIENYLKGRRKTKPMDIV